MGKRALDSKDILAETVRTSEAGRVIVFDQGRIVQDGTHDELVAEGGIYGNLYESWQRGTSV